MDKDKRRYNNIERLIQQCKQGLRIPQYSGEVGFAYLIYRDGIFYIEMHYSPEFNRVSLEEIDEDTARFALTARY